MVSPLKPSDRVNKPEQVREPSKKEGGISSLLSYIWGKPVSESPFPELMKALGPDASSGRFYSDVIESLNRAPQIAFTLEQVAKSRNLYQAGKISKKEWEVAKAPLGKIFTTPTVVKLSGIIDLLDSEKLAETLVEEAKLIRGTDNASNPKVLQDPHNAHVVHYGDSFAVAGSLAASPLQVKLKELGYVKDTRFPFWHRVTQDKEGNWTVGIARLPSQILEVRTEGKHLPHALNYLLEAGLRGRSQARNIREDLEKEVLKEAPKFYETIKNDFPTFPLTEKQYQALTSSYVDFENLRLLLGQLLIDRKGEEANRAAGTFYEENARLSNLLAQYSAMYQRNPKLADVAAPLITFVRQEVALMQTARADAQLVLEARIRAAETSPARKSEGVLLSEVDSLKLDSSVLVELDRSPVARWFVRERIDRGEDPKAAIQEGLRDAWRIDRDKKELGYELFSRQWIPSGIKQYWTINHLDSPEVKAREVGGKIYRTSVQFDKDLPRCQLLFEGRELFGSRGEHDTGKFIEYLQNKGFTKEEIESITHIANQASFGTYMHLLFADYGTLDWSILNQIDVVYDISRKEGELAITAEVPFMEMCPTDIEKTRVGVKMRLIFLPNQGSILLEAYVPKI